VDMSVVRRVDEQGLIQGLTGRKLKVGRGETETWNKNCSGASYELFHVFPEGHGARRRRGELSGGSHWEAKSVGKGRLLWKRKSKRIHHTRQSTLHLSP
jgi:hypothetical protein